MSTRVTIIPGTIPDGFCHQTWQKTYNEFIRATRAELPGNFNTFNYGSVTPSADNRDKPWLKTSGDGSPERWYVWYNGNWVWPHPILPNPNFCVMWLGSPADLLTYDGGVDETVGGNGHTGPFWEIVTELAGKMPIGVGDLPSGDAVARGQTGGLDKMTLDPSQFRHFHWIAADAVSNDGGGDIDSEGTILRRKQGGSDEQGYRLIKGESALSASVGRTSVAGGATTENTPEEINLMPPFYGLYIIRRTNRLFYKV